MLKFMFLFLCLLFAPMVIANEENQLISNQNVPSFVLCNSAKTRCTVGAYTLRSNGTPLFVNGGIMCTTDKRMCTNGYYVMRSTDPLY